MEILDNNFETNTCVSKSTLEFTYSKKNGGSEVEITPTPIEEGDKYIAGPFVAIKNSSNMILPVQNDINVFDGRTLKLSELFGVHVINKPLGFKKIGIIQSSDIQISYIFDKVPSFVDNNKKVLIGYQINGVNHDKVEVTIDDNNVDFVTLNKDDYRVEETKRVLLTSRGRDGELTHGYFTNGVDAYFSDGTISNDKIKIITDRITECFFYEKINGKYVNIPVEEVIYGAGRKFYYKTAYDKDGDAGYKFIENAAFDNKKEGGVSKLMLYVKKFTDDVYDENGNLVVHAGDIVTLENESHVGNNGDNIEYVSLEDNFSLHHYIECDSISELVTTDGYGDACRMTTSEIGDYIQKIEADFRDYKTTTNNSTVSYTGNIYLKFITAKNDEEDVQNDMKMVHLPKNKIPFLSVEETRTNQRIETKVNLYTDRRQYKIPNENEDETWAWDITVNTKIYSIGGSYVLGSFDFVVPSDAYELIFTERCGVKCDFYGVEYSSGRYEGEVGDEGYKNWVEKVLKTIIIYNVSPDTSDEIRWTEKNAGAHKQFICYLKEYLDDNVTDEQINNGKFKTKRGFIFDDRCFYEKNSEKKYDLPVRIYRVDDAEKEDEVVLSKDYWCNIMLLDGKILKFRFRRGEVTKTVSVRQKDYIKNGFMEGIGLERKLKNDSGGYTEYKINVRDNKNEVVSTLNLGNVGENNKRVLLHPVMCQSSFQDLVEEVVDYYNGDQMDFTTTSDGVEWYGFPIKTGFTKSSGGKDGIKIELFDYTDGYDFFYRLKRKLVGDNVIQYFYTSIYNACVPNVVILTTKKVEPTQGDDQSVQSTTVVSKYAVFTGTEKLNECWGDNDKSCRYLKYYKFSVNIFTGTDDNRNTIMLGEVGELEEHKYDVTQDNNTTTSTFRGKKVDVSFVEGNLEDYTWEITDITGMKILFKNTSTSWRGFKNIEKTINESTTNQENGE